MAEPTLYIIAEMLDVFSGRLFAVFLLEHLKIIGDGSDIMPFVLRGQETVEFETSVLRASLWKRHDKFQD